MMLLQAAELHHGCFKSARGRVYVHPPPILLLPSPRRRSSRRRRPSTHFCHRFLVQTARRINRVSSVSLVSSFCCFIIEKTHNIYSVIALLSVQGPRNDETATSVSIWQERTSYSTFFPSSIFTPSLCLCLHLSPFSFRGLDARRNGGHWLCGERRKER